VKTAITDIKPADLGEFVTGLGMKNYAADQILAWLYARLVTSFDEMSNISKSGRERLKEECDIAALKKVGEEIAEDGTRKLLCETRDGECVECVLLPSEGERLTACLSTQSGCAMGCSFCRTAEMGLKRNLTLGEITGQLVLLSREAGCPITNIVLMGMGEPLANFDAMMRAIHWLVDESGLGMRQRGVTVSTVGLLRPIERLADERLQIGLTISLHAPNDELRRRLVPTSGAATIDALVDAGLAYQATTGRRVTFAYALLEEVNDTTEHARELAERLRGRAVHVNLVPYNPTAGVDLRRPSNTRVRRFQQELLDGGVNATVRVERGIEIAAACGQLRTDVLGTPIAPR